MEHDASSLQLLIGLRSTRWTSTRAHRSEPIRVLWHYLDGGDRRILQRGQVRRARIRHFAPILTQFARGRLLRGKRSVPWQARGKTSHGSGQVYEAAEASAAMGDNAPQSRWIGRIVPLLWVLGVTGARVAPLPIAEHGREAVTVTRQPDGGVQRVSHGSSCAGSRRSCDGPL